MVDKLMQSFNADKYGPGLQAPAIDPIMMASMMAGPSLMRAMQGVGEMAPRALAGEAGAIFPEGAPIPKDKSLIKEFGDVLPESRKAYLRNQQLSDWHAENQDWPRVLADKWAMLKHTGGS